MLVSSGTLLAAIALDIPMLTGAALLLLIVSTLALSAFFLLVELVERGRRPGADVLAVSAEVFGLSTRSGGGRSSGSPTNSAADDAAADATGDAAGDADEEIGITIPAATALLGLTFAVCAIMIAGLPPFAGFVGKFAMLHALLELDPVPVSSWIMLALLIGSGFATVIGMARAGVQRFWASPDMDVPRVRVVELAPIVVLLVICTVLTVEAGPSMAYLDAAAQMLHAPDSYVHEVLGGR